MSARVHQEAPSPPTSRWAGVFRAPHPDSVSASGNQGRTDSSVSASVGGAYLALPLSPALSLAHQGRTDASGGAMDASGGAADIRRQGLPPGDVGASAAGRQGGGGGDGARASHQPTGGTGPATARVLSDASHQDP